MCGIAGFCLTPEDCYTTNQGKLAGDMLLAIEHRGKDATGSAWINPRSKKRTILKHAIPAHKYVKTVAGHLCNEAQTAILHTRWATQGTPSNRDNNHPIPRGNIVLTHNGHISNDNELFKRLNVKRRAQVDSEAVSALIAFTARDYHPSEVLGSIAGTAALAWIDSSNARTLHLARVNHSPLWIGQTKSGSFLYGSTLDTLVAGAWHINSEVDWTHQAEEGTYFKIVDGRVAEYEKFKREYSLIPKARYEDVCFDERMNSITTRRAI
jgi:glucosamine--fructose-6-phosphate aminotransferase (isomerizing)